MNIVTGWIPPSERTSQQEQAHATALATMPRFAIPGSKATGKETVLLYEAWYAAKVIEDVGYRFDRFHQWTGSCVGAGGGNGLFTLIAIQRLFSKNPTKAFIPWWLYNYGRSRYYMGDRNKGQGSLGSTFAKSLRDDGVITSTEKGLPPFINAGDEGTHVQGEEVEYDWSDGDSRLVLDYSDEGRLHPLGQAAEVTTIEQIDDSLINGYPCTFACDRYVGNPRVKSGVLIGTFDTWGGHQVSILGRRVHDTLGVLYWMQNNWPKDVYPKNPEPNQPTCGCWIEERELRRALGYQAEVFALGHLPWFPAQPEIAIPWIV